MNITIYIKGGYSIVFPAGIECSRATTSIYIKFHRVPQAYSIAIAPTTNFVYDQSSLISSFH